jgi:hypothetical protein
MKVEEAVRGTPVLIKKGTPIRSTGKVREKVAGRDYVVTVHHTLRGVNITAHTALNDRHFSDVIDKMGIDKNELLALRDSDPLAFHCNCNIQTRPPMVVWAGAGGYWHEAPADMVEIAKC